ncbi:MAG: hypothetical protein JSS89_13015 [Bacteroidetes bacterium]|nr:hypothetical protein [Bacteroidota bacterium]
MTAKRQASPTGGMGVTIGANFLGAVLMIVAFFLADNMWYLVAAGLLIAAGVGMIFFMRHVRNKFNV